MPHAEPIRILKKARTTHAHDHGTRIPQQGVAVGAHSHTCTEVWRAVCDTAWGRRIYTQRVTPHVERLRACALWVCCIPVWGFVRQFSLELPFKRSAHFFIACEWGDSCRVKEQEVKCVWTKCVVQTIGTTCWFLGFDLQFKVSALVEVIALGNGNLSM